MRNKSRQALFIAFVLLIAISCGRQNTKDGGPEWNGTMETIGGVIVVKNPIEPIFGEGAFVVEEELDIGDSEGREEYMFQSLRSIGVSETGDIYALDGSGQHIKVFDQDGSYLTTIGREGQGPGEFFLPLALIMTGGGEIVVGDFNRISFFSSEGEFLKGIPLSTGSLLNIDIDYEGNIFGYSIDRGNMVYALKKYDQELNELCLFGSSPLPSVEFSKTGRRNAFFAILSWDIINGNQVVTGYPEEGYILKILDSSGNQIRRIEKEHVPVEITQEDFEEVIDGLPSEIKKDYYAPKYFPPFSALRADDEGRIWVVTPGKVPEKGKRIWDVFDAEGRYILRVALKAAPYIFINKMYTIEEDENGFHCIKRYNIIWRTGE